MHYQRARLRGTIEDIAPDPAVGVCQYEPCGVSLEGYRWGAMYCSRFHAEKAREAQKREERQRAFEVCDNETCTNRLDDKRIQARFCSNKCSTDYRNGMRSKERKAEKLAAPPRYCPGCGEAIPPERPTHVIFHDAKCKALARTPMKYGLTVQQAGELMHSQNGCCAICETNDWGIKGPQIDHCHTTGAVRGILCLSCNNGLGRFGDNPERLERAAAYLRKAVA